MIYGEDNIKYRSVFNNQVSLRNKKVYDRIGYCLECANPAVVEANIEDRYNAFFDYGRNGKLPCLAPSFIKSQTLDDPSLLFIHAGISTMHHGYKVPDRYKHLN